jgi:hypothetical protein
MYEISLQQLVDYSTKLETEIDVPFFEEKLIDPYSKNNNSYDTMYLKDDIEWMKENGDDSYLPLEVLYQYMEDNHIEECCVVE